MIDFFKNYFIQIALTILGTFFLFRSFGFCSDVNAEYRFSARIFHDVNSNYGDSYKVTSEMRRKWQSELEFHQFHAKRTFEDAKNKCWYLPDKTDREKAKYCYTTVFALFGFSSPTGKIVAAISSLIMQYGLDCIDEYEYINTKLNWSQYHFEMCDHYQELLDKA